MKTHKAFRLHSYGGPDTISLDDVPMPTLLPTQVLVAVAAVGMNPFDWKIREGYLKDAVPLPLPAILGVDFVGRVAAIGEDVTRFAIGERVTTISTSLGAYAEHIAVEEDILARVPDALSDVDAATLGIPSLAAWHAVHAFGPIRLGMRVLVHGASGVSGAFAVQFAKLGGAEVIGTASGKNRDYVMGLGADGFVDYQTERFEDRVSDVDLVVDCVLIGGDQNTTDRSWSVLRPNGAVVSIADPNILARIPAGYRGDFPRIEADAPRLEALAALLASGAIKTKVARVFDRAQLVDAMEINRAGGTTGRLIVDFSRA